MRWKIEFEHRITSHGEKESRRSPLNPSPTLSGQCKHTPFPIALHPLRVQHSQLTPIHHTCEVLKFSLPPSWRVLSTRPLYEFVNCQAPSSRVPASVEFIAGIVLLHGYIHLPRVPLGSLLNLRLLSDNAHQLFPSSSRGGQVHHDGMVRALWIVSYEYINSAAWLVIS